MAPRGARACCEPSCRHANLQASAPSRCPPMRRRPASVTARPEIWRLPAGVSLLWQSWDEDEVIVFNRGSGQTHLLDAFSAAVLRRIEASPTTTADLAAFLRDGIRARRERADPPGRCGLRALRPAGPGRAGRAMNVGDLSLERFAARLAGRGRGDPLGSVRIPHRQPAARARRAAAPALRGFPARAAGRHLRLPRLHPTAPAAAAVVGRSDRVPGRP